MRVTLERVDKGSPVMIFHSIPTYTQKAIRGVVTNDVLSRRSLNTSQFLNNHLYKRLHGVLATCSKNGVRKIKPTWNICWISISSLTTVDKAGINLLNPP